jgi:hypothetical protein
MNYTYPNLCLGGISLKRVLLLASSLLLCLSLSVGALADFDIAVDYMELMIDAAVAGDTACGIAAQCSRDEKIASSGADYANVDFTELLLLSKIIQAEAGSAWLDADWKMSVGEVVLNRIASPEFPNDMAGVVYQPGQYYGRSNAYFNCLLPSRESASAAARLLSGDRVLNDPAVVFQSNGKQGSGVFRELKDPQLGSTYLCYSNYMELYSG